MINEGLQMETDIIVFYQRAKCQETGSLTVKWVLNGEQKF